MTDLAHHGDVELAPGLIDLAVNVRTPTPGWLVDVVREASTDLSAYPRPDRAREAVAVRHGRRPTEVLLTAGAAEAFVLLARATRPHRAVVVHPQFTEPEAALRAAGHRVERVVLDAQDGFPLDPCAIPADADLVLLGNPTNPTSVVHHPDVIASLARPGRILVIDEAFADTIPGESASLAHRDDLPGLVVIRSLTKTFGLAGLRIGYVLAEPGLISQLRAAQGLWAVSAPALATAEACCSDRGRAEAEAYATQLTRDRAALLDQLPARVAAPPASSFVLVEVPGGEMIHQKLRERGYAVRRGGTFPGLTTDHLRIAVRDSRTMSDFCAALSTVAGQR